MHGEVIKKMSNGDPSRNSRRRGSEWELTYGLCKNPTCTVNYFCLPFFPFISLLWINFTFLHCYKQGRSFDLLWSVKFGEKNMSSLERSIKNEFLPVLVSFPDPGPEKMPASCSSINLVPEAQVRDKGI